MNNMFSPRKRYTRIRLAAAAPRITMRSGSRAGYEQRRPQEEEGDSNNSSGAGSGP